MTATLGADSIPAIAERDATGDVAALYEDLRDTLGVPFVNLIWRHLATVPGALAWTWKLVKPLYVSGEIDRLSTDTAAPIDFPSLAPVPDFAWDSAGVRRDHRQTIAAMIENYNHANGANFLALLTALSMLRDGLPAHAAAPPATAPVKALRTAPDLPPLPGLSELPPHLLALVRQLDQFGRLGPSDAIASLYRHLAHWPAFLAIAYTALNPLQRHGDFVDAQQHVARFGQAKCARLSTLIDRDLPTLAPESQAAVQRALDEFTRLMIGRMIVMGKAMRSLLPH